MSMVHFQVHDACLSLCCMSKSMLQSMSMHYVHVHAVHMSLSIPHVRVHAACPCTWFISLSLLHFYTALRHFFRFKSFLFNFLYLFACEMKAKRCENALFSPRSDKNFVTIRFEVKRSVLPPSGAISTSLLILLIQPLFLRWPPYSN
jgi:hypothetical protein